ncbi:ATP-binding cassette domain-containing protein [Streptomyces werraensis]|uniref:ATP-binding cassette domain-containing protein n=1 Tax=Streptomyces werraensis TaxID=68284 RepID=UPI001CE2661A
MTSPIPTASIPPPSGQQPLLSLRGVSKTFGAVRALTDVDLDICAGEVVALLGDNGAGKSTLVKTLSGVHPPDSGTITFDGAPVNITSPGESRSLGIATVYQDLALCDNLDVVANLFLGHERTRFTLSEEDMEEQAWSLLRQLSAKIPSVRTLVAGLSGGQRQTVAIARSLIGDPSIIILDEPTAALGVEQTAEVLNLIERLRDRGHGVLLITHNMADVREVADRAVVLRLGRNNGVFRVKDVTHEEIVAAITGAADSAVTRRAAATAATAASQNTEGVAP